MSAYPRRHRGSAATPLEPWTKRRAALIALLAQDDMVVNRRYCRQTTHNSLASRDLRRLIAEGFAVLTGKRRHGGGAAYRYLTLTESGKAHVKTAVPKREVQPYAKRQAALAALKATPASDSVWD